jgi:hypothetical protein
MHRLLHCALGEEIHRSLYPLRCIFAFDSCCWSPSKSAHFIFSLNKSKNTLSKVNTLLGCKIHRLLHCVVRLSPTRECNLKRQIQLCIMSTVAASPLK